MARIGKLPIVEWRLKDSRLVAAFDDVVAGIPHVDIARFPALEVLEVRQTTCGANVRASFPGVMQIRLAPGRLIVMTRGSAPALRGLVAHELAHAFFRHPARDAAERDGVAEEQEADAKAVEWVGAEAVAEFRASVGPSITSSRRRAS